jgi:hypothetical protein
MALTGAGRRQLALQLSAVAGRAWCGLGAESRSYAGAAWGAGVSRTATAAGSPRVAVARLSHPLALRLSCRDPHRGHELAQCARDAYWMLASRAWICTAGVARLEAPYAQERWMSKSSSTPRAAGQAASTSSPTTVSTSASTEWFYSLGAPLSV